MGGVLMTTMKRIMPINQQEWFILGYTRQGFDYPFPSERVMYKVWEKHKPYLLGLMHRDRSDQVFSEWLAPDGNALRPWFYWFNGEGPERKILNGAKRIPGNRKYGNFFDKNPAQETESQALERAGLLTDADRRWMKGDVFVEAEVRSIIWQQFLIKEDLGGRKPVPPGKSP